MSAPPSADRAIIEKGIPLPDANRHQLKVPFREMAIGDSVFVNDDQMANVSANACYHTKRHPEFSFTRRKVPGGWRIWRVASPVRVSVEKGVPIPKARGRWDGKKR